MKQLVQYLDDRPWIFIAVAFTGLLFGLATVVVIAEKNKPISIVLEKP